MPAPLEAARAGRLPSALALASLNLALATLAIATVVIGARLGSPFEDTSALDVAITATLLAPFWLAAWCGTWFGLRGFDRFRVTPPSWGEAVRRGLLGGALSGPAFAGGLAAWALAFGLVGTVTDPDRGTISEIARGVPVYLAAVTIYSMLALLPATAVGVLLGLLFGPIDRAIFFGLRSEAGAPPTPPA